MSFTVAPVVEGYGDVDAVRVLLQHLAPELTVGRPVRQGRGLLVKRDGLKYAVNIAAANIKGAGAVLVLFDADRDCAAQLATELAGWLAADFPHLTCRVVLAVRGFESWIVGGDAVFAVDDPDHTGDPKRAIEQHYGRYKKTVDQPKYIARSDFDRLQANSRSFRRMKKVVDEFQEMA